MVQLATIRVGESYLLADPDCLLINDHLVKVEAVLEGRWLLVSFDPRSVHVLQAWGFPVEGGIWYPFRPKQLRHLTGSQRARLGLQEKVKNPPKRCNTGLLAPSISVKGG